MDFSEIIVAIIIGLVILAINSLGAKKQQSTKNQPRRQRDRSLMSEESAPVENSEKEEEESWGIPRTLTLDEIFRELRKAREEAERQEPEEQGPRRGRTARTRRGGVHSARAQAAAPATRTNDIAIPAPKAGTTTTANRVAARFPVGTGTSTGKACGENASRIGRPVGPRSRRNIGLFAHARLCNRGNPATGPDRRVSRRPCHRRRRDRLAQGGYRLGNSEPKILTMNPWQ